MNALPGGAIATRPLHFIWILDTSGSMMGDKIQSLNFAIHEAIKPIQKEAALRGIADKIVVYEIR